MTIGQLIESLMGKACVLHGGFGNCTAYTNNGTKHESFGSVLTEYGYHSSGTEVLYNGMTGEQIKSDIYIGPTYYMRLKQMVKDKINYRSQGPRTQLTRQTVQGRANDGGLRVGEMERDGILGHGAAHFLNESLMVRGDEYHMAVCNKSGMIAIYNPNQNLFMSPMVDGPIQYSGNLADAASGGAGAGASVIHMTKFGRSFSIVRIPYCLKLLMQELLVMNVQMRIITEDNIDQLPSMSYSNNVYKVLKDGRGAMGVDDIIERNRLAAGLKPRLAAATASAATSSQAMSVDYDAEETANGSRVYLPSRSEEQEDTGKRYLASDIVNDAGNPSQDPDDRIEEIIPGLSMIQSFRIRTMGWRFAVKEERRRDKSFNIADVTSEDLVLESIILDKNGEPTERWNISGPEWKGDYPTRYPDGWLTEMLLYPDDTPILPGNMIGELRKIRKPLNWVLSIISLIERHGRRKMAERTQAESVMADENIRNIEANERESARVSDEIERARREGDVAYEERLKVQMTRLADERIKLDSVRREIEEQDAAAGAAGAADYFPGTPGYTSSSPVGGEEDDAGRVRGAVASFNAKMLDKYGDDDQNIPESEGSTPRTPSTPEYSSIFEGGGQRGGRGGARGKFIPQIPTSIVDSYLTSRYGTSAASSVNAASAASAAPVGVMTGGMPTMNIPIVATMPMAGMMPIQQTQQQTQQVGGGQQQQTQQVGGGQQQQQQAGTTTQPNEQGVRTFSITPFKT
jgi:hypothetical protein